MTELKPPTRTTGDAGHALAKAILGSVPVVGAAGAEVFTYLIAEPLEKRRDKWMDDVGAAIEDLRLKRGVDLEELHGNSTFTDAVLTATHAALRTSDATKHDALRHAILNAALPFAPSAAVQQTFIRMIDDFTPWHLRLLDLFADPKAWLESQDIAVSKANFGSPSDIVETAFEELKPHRNLYDQWWRDLHVRGLVTIDQLHTMMSSQGAIASRTTELGRDFLVFVRAAVLPAG